MGTQNNIETIFGGMRQAIRMRSRERRSKLPAISKLRRVKPIYTMIKNLTEKLVDEIQRQLSNNNQAIPAREINIALQAVLTRLDLVTREEFDAQAAVLQRTRQKLEQLEQQLSALEQ